MDGVDCSDGFHFDYHSALDHKVDSISHFKFMAFINYRQRNFRRDLETSSPWFVRQAELIGAFEEAWAQEGVDFHSGIHDGAGDVVYARGTGAGGSSHEYYIADFPVFLCDPCGERCS